MPWWTASASACRSRRWEYRRGRAEAGARATDHEEMSMISNHLTPAHVLVLRDELPIVGYQAEGNETDEPQRAEELLSREPRLRVTVARAGYGEAVQAAQKHRPDVVLLDGVLGDPVELVAELDEALQKLPVL